MENSQPPLLRLATAVRPTCNLIECNRHGLVTFLTNILKVKSTIFLIDLSIKGFETIGTHCSGVERRIVQRLHS